MVNEKWTVGVNPALAFDAAGNIVAAEPPAAPPAEEGQEVQEGQPVQEGQEGQPEQETADGQQAGESAEGQPPPEEQLSQEQLPG